MGGGSFHQRYGLVYGSKERRVVVVMLYRHGWGGYCLKWCQDGGMASGGVRSFYQRYGQR